MKKVRSWFNGKYKPTKMPEGTGSYGSIPRLEGKLQELKNTGGDASDIKALERSIDQRKQGQG